MFGINDDNNQNQPAAAASDAPVMPQPVTSVTPPDDKPIVNPISGNQTLGPPEVSSGLPPVLPGAGSPKIPSLTDNKQLLPATPPPLPEPTTSPFPSPAAPPPDMPMMSKPRATAVPNADELLGIKKEALQSLTPLVGELEQSPTEKFKTIMMLLQASDNPELVKEAYEAANKIEDEKAKAQALLDVVNEINYFTHPEKPVEKPPLS